MKILFLAAASSAHTVRWVNTLAERKHEVYLVFNADHAPKKDSLHSDIRLYPLKQSGGKAYYLNAYQLKKVYRVIRPDVVNVHYASGYGTLARMAGIKETVLSVWGSDVYEFPYKGKIQHLILKRNVKYAKALASTSQCMAEQLRKVAEIKDRDITITPFGIDLSQFQPVSKEHPDVNQVTIGCIKSLKPLYRIDDLVRSISELNKLLTNEGNNISIKAVIYGEGEQKAELIELSRKLQMEEIISFPGWLPNAQVPEALSKMDIFCATSLQESFGVAVIEAMAMELPTVVTDTVGFKEVSVNGETGFIVERKNVTEITQALYRLTIDKEMRDRLGKNGRKRVKEYYDWQENVDRMERLYFELKRK